MFSFGREYHQKLFKSERAQEIRDFFVYWSKYTFIRGDEYTFVHYSFK